MPVLRSLTGFNFVGIYRHGAPAGAFSPANTVFIPPKIAKNLKPTHSSLMAWHRAIPIPRLVCR
jgi:hypothetical protein